IFTDTRDDSVGGDTNGDGNTTTPTPTNSSYSRVSVTGGKSSRFDYVVFNNADVGLFVGEFTEVTVLNSKFVNTQMAIDVAAAGSADAGTGYLYSNLPCAPPFDSQVNVWNTWFGKFGLPGVASDISSLGGVLVDGIGNEGMSFAYDQMAGQIELRGQNAFNATPWAYYKCATPTVPPIPIAFPWTPVIVNTPALVEWLPAVADVR
ncbi:hypothetical protein, partial [Salinibacterium xinjiangense]